MKHPLWFYQQLIADNLKIKQLIFFLFDCFPWSLIWKQLLTLFAFIVICLFEYLDLVLFKGVFSCFHLILPPKFMARCWLPFHLASPFTKGFQTSSSSTRTTWCISCVKLLDISPWQQSYLDLSLSKVCYIDWVVSVFSVTISK